ncbi:segregation/condensation protein A [Candidatus Woesearchaeota archaeon]|nr:segregation/condensation protein A [Candidatus Woesearchaeota archaeon]
MEDQLFSILMDQDEITWKDIIYDLVRTERMNPWDIDLGSLTKRFIERLNQLKETNFKLSGKAVLAAALLLKIKANRLVGEDLDALDALIAQKDVDEHAFYDELQAEMRPAGSISDEEKMHLIPKTPQPRQRKVSIFDLVNALEKALEVKKRRLIKHMPPLDIAIPYKKRDMTLSIKRLYKIVLERFSKTQPVHFEHLLHEGHTREDKIFTFLPLLHLANERKVDLEQERPFETIKIHVIDPAKLYKAPLAPLDDEKTDQH